MSATEKVTLTLPQNLMQEVRARTSARGQSKFVAEAVQYYIERKRLIELREELIAGYQATADKAAAVAVEWEPLGREAWERYVPAFEDEESDDDAIQ
jgi:metal-responsive CopG/Arc/MetJ family transcriptional regulator